MKIYQITVINTIYNTPYFQPILESSKLWNNVILPAIKESGVYHIGDGLIMGDFYNIAHLITIVEIPSEYQNLKLSLLEKNEILHNIPKSS